MPIYLLLHSHYLWLLEKLMARVVDFWGLWLMYCDLYDILFQSQGDLSGLSAGNRGHLPAWYGLGLGFLDIGELLAWGRVGSWPRQRKGKDELRATEERGGIYIEEKRCFWGIWEQIGVQSKPGSPFTLPAESVTEKKLTWSQKILPCRPHS